MARSEREQYHRHQADAVRLREFGIRLMNSRIALVRRSGELLADRGERERCQMIVNSWSKGSR